MDLDTSATDLDLDSVDLNGFGCTLETCWCYEPHTHFILSIHYSRERTL